MRQYFHLSASQLTLLSVALLCPVTSFPRSPLGLLPAMGRPKLESTLLHLRPNLDDPRRDPWLLQRAQRGELVVARPLSPFPGGGLSLESPHYQEGGEGGEEGGKKSHESLNSIAGGLQAVSREKGGFGFRFGRKRWTDRGWRDEGRGSAEENK